MIAAAPPCSAPPPQLAWASPSQFAASKPLSQHRQLAWAAKKNLSYNQTPRAFPRLSLSIPPRRNNEFRKHQHQHLQQLCLSAFSPPPHIKTNNNYNNKSRFTLSLALPNSNYDKEEEEEEEPTASSALHIQQKIPTYVKFTVEYAWKGQLLLIITDACFLAHIFLLTGLITSPIAICAAAAGTISANISVFSVFNMFLFLALVEEQQHIATDALKAPLRADIMKHIKYTIPMNLFGIGATILGMQSGFALETQNLISNYDIAEFFEAFFRTRLRRGSIGAVICHLIGLASSLVLLRWITKPSTSEDAKIPPALDQILRDLS